MICLVCAHPDNTRLCGRCRQWLVPADDRCLRGGILVRSAWAHSGPARVLVHRLKYAGIRAAAGVLAERMADVMAEGATALVPVRRVRVRAWRYGIDPAWELAGALGALLGMPVVDVLVPPLWAPPHAGAGRDRRSKGWFGIRSRQGGGRLVLVDDVVTTGATLLAAQAAVGAPGMSGITATAAGRVVV